MFRGDSDRCARAIGLFVGLLVASVGTSCGGGGGGDSAWWTSYGAGTDVPADDDDAARFLTQATFGPQSSEIEGLSFAGFDAWFDRQMNLPPSLHRPLLEQLDAAGVNVGRNQRSERWWQIAIQGQDQLRQRVAFALSQIFVISDQDGTLGNDAIGVAEFQDILVRNALGDWRQLLEEVTLSPAMGVYLSMLKNEKPDIANNIRPDENYAREVLQLFSIGLVRLHLDGTVMLDGFGAPIPTYDQAVVEGFAHVFTGWNYADASSWNWPQRNYRPMEPWEEYHDTGAKTLLDGFVVPAGQTAEEDLAMALDVIFQHPNVGPYMSRLLIQRLVTSNPTPAYVQRVATVFNDDGTGMRGNLGAVVQAILLDDEAREGHPIAPDEYGKLKEPLLRQTALWRAFHAFPTGGKFSEWNPQNHFGQAPMRSPSVFNFYYPDWQPQGEFSTLSLYGPEFQITTHQFSTSTTNRFYDLVFRHWYGSSNSNTSTPVLNLAEPRALAEDPVALVDWLDRMLAGGRLSSTVKNLISSHVTAIDFVDDMGPAGTERVLEATYLVLTSPEAAAQY